jgi:hypothetical protein
LLRVQLPPGDRFYLDLQGYLFWYLESPEEDLPVPSMGKILLAFCMICCALGMIIGALFETIDQVRLAVQVGAAIVACLGAFVGAALENGFRRNVRLAPGIIGGAFFGLIAGAVVGAAAGGMALAYAGTLPGAIAGTILSKVLEWLKWRGPGTFVSTLAGAAIGAMVVAFVENAGNAASGAAFGGLIGFGGGVLFLLGMFAYSVVAMRSEQPK